MAICESSFCIAAQPPQKRRREESTPGKSSPIDRLVCFDSQGSQKQKDQVLHGIREEILEHLGRCITASKHFKQGELILVEDSFVFAEASPIRNSLRRMSTELSGDDGPSVSVSSCLDGLGEHVRSALSLEGTRMKWSGQRASSMLAFLEACSLLSEADRIQVCTDFDKCIDSASPLHQLVRITAEAIHSSGVFHTCHKEACIDDIPVGVLSHHEIEILCMVKVVNCHAAPFGGAALFQRLSRLAHHCIANCVYTPKTHESSELNANNRCVGRLVAARAIQDGEVLSISYMQQSVLNFPSNRRKAALFLLRGFSCACPACIGNDPFRVTRCPCGAADCRVMPSQSGRCCSWSSTVCNYVYDENENLMTWKTWLEETEDRWMRKLEELQGKEIVLLDEQYSSESSESESELFEKCHDTPHILARRDFSFECEVAGKAAADAREQLGCGHWITTRLEAHWMHSSCRAALRLAFRSNKCADFHILDAVKDFVEAVTRRAQGLATVGIPAMVLDDLGIDVHLAHKLLLAFWKTFIPSTSADCAAQKLGLLHAISMLCSGEWPDELAALGALIEVTCIESAKAFGKEAAQVVFAERVKKEWEALRRMCLDGHLASVKI